VPEDAAVVLVHDAARPVLPEEVIERVLTALNDGWDGAIPVLPLADTVKRIESERVVETVEREGLALAQTPQAFSAAALRDAHERAVRDGFDGSDDALLLERAGYRVRAIAGERTNLKITTPDDIRLAEALAR
jgi:2-C-methyl-D-erythritol 4-phosphate cytidylyltransferase